MIEQGTSIGFGGGEVVRVADELHEVADVLNAALQDQVFVEFFVGKNHDKAILINPMQVKVLQRIEQAGDSCA